MRREDMVVEHSGDSGRNWHEVTPVKGAPLWSYLMGLQPMEVHDDGTGNLYRWSPR